ncbi:MAG: mevalonate kinase [Thermoplasmatales archaeon]|jgi:mevalonate kinase|nr:mevalonate kinase [Thermoplasmatales archaeon]
MKGKCVRASAPGKLIVLGEHSVVFGKPALALAIDRRFRCEISPGSGILLNGTGLSPRLHPHIDTILRKREVSDLNIITDSNIPSGSGLGSSAALSAALISAVRLMRGEDCGEEAVAREAFETEYEVQGRASPIDTSTSAHGGGVAVNCPEGMGKPIWNISKGENSWTVSDIPVPEMTFVVGYTGIKAATGPLVEKVRKYKESNRFASDIIDEIGDLTLEGMAAVSRDDKEHLGGLMTRDHKLLSILGVSCRELNRLVDASLEYSYGAKLTGSGGGGSMIALTDEPEKVCKAISLRGGEPFIVRTGVPGSAAGFTNS